MLCPPMGPESNVHCIKRSNGEGPGGTEGRISCVPNDVVR